MGVGVTSEKYATCKDFDFYRSVIDEEGAAFEITLNLMKRLADDKKSEYSSDSGLAAQALRRGNEQ